MDKNLCVLIMAGGKGTRFWPKSTESMPKQFLNLIGNKTMIQMTYERALKIVPSEKIFIVTNEKYKNLVKEQISCIAEKNIIIEPIGKNTAPCILLSTLYINQLYEKSNIVVLPADHIIMKEESFVEKIKLANNYLNEEGNNENIITLGITPTRPEIGYGYIKFINSEKEILDVECFVEKPDFKKAKEYLDSKLYLWNAGMFIFNTDFMLKELEKNIQKDYNSLSSLPLINDINYQNELNRIYSNCEAISIDYAVMEKSNNIKVIPADLGWDDIGTWLSLQRYILPDKNNNYINGDVIVIDSSNNVVYANNKKVILLGLEDTFYIESNDVIVIGKKENLRNVHELRTKI